jgi:hypothetical protein
MEIGTFSNVLRGLKALISASKTVFFSDFLFIAENDWTAKLKFYPDFHLE